VKPRIAFVVKNYTIERSPTILQILKTFKTNNWETLLITENVGPIPNKPALANIQQTIPKSTFQKLVLFTKLRYRGKIDCIWAFDAHGFHLAKQFAGPTRLIYHSLELFLSSNSYNLPYPKSLARFERKHINKISALVIQSEERYTLFRNDYNLSPDIPAILVPVCAEGPATLVHKPLPDRESALILHLGAICNNHGIPAFALQMARTSNWKLLLHGHSYPECDGLIEDVQKGRIKNVMYSEKYFALPSDSEILCEGTHVGLAWYEPNLSPNYDTAALSSGKIASYLKHGLPLIVRKHGSFETILAKRKCAVAIETPYQLPQALDEIRRNYAEMRLSAFRVYEELYRLETHQAKLLQIAPPNLATRHK
jgi:hypothetical protein